MADLKKKTKKKVVKKAVKKTVKAPKKSPKKTKYILTFDCNDTDFTVEGDTWPELWDKLELPRPKSKGAVTLKEGKKIAIIEVMPRAMKRIFFNKLAMEILFKKLVVKLK